MRKDREAPDQGARDPRSYERRTDYGRSEKSYGSIREYGVTTGAVQSYYSPETTATTEDPR